MTDGRFRSVAAACALALAAFGTTPARAEEGVTKTWAFAEFGEPLYKDGFDHWPYANPDAPKGGKIVLGAFGTFDTLNPYILKGEFPSSIGLIYDSLMTGSADEIMGYYGSIAETAEFPEDRSWIIFNLRPEARYSDGVSITAPDFCFTLDIYKKHSRPFLKSFVTDIESCEALSDHRVRFNVRTRDSMKPLTIAAGLGPSPRHFWSEQDVTKTTLTPPPASGAYRIKDVDPGRSITYERVKDYWAADLPIKKGLNNFDEVRFEYYRDPTVMFEAFKAGQIDFRSENSAKRWVTEYDFPAIEKGKVVSRTLPMRTPTGVSGYFMNLRRPQFQDIRVRRAINYLYDFETTQRTLLYGKYQRSQSYFPNSDYGASGPPTPEELAILEPYRAQLPPEVFEKAFELPKTDGSGRIRRNLRQALSLFKEAGYELRDGKLVKAESGEQLSFEFLTGSPETARLISPFLKNLEQAGIDAQLRLMDPAQWRSRIDQSDFDIYSARNNFFPPPGTELRQYFSSKGSDQPGGGNRIGYSSPVAEVLMDQIVAARDLETLKATTRALDRVVLWNFNIIPQYHKDESWFAYWNKFGYPERHPKYGVGFPGTWWLDQDLARELASR